MKDIITIQLFDASQKLIIKKKLISQKVRHALMTVRNRRNPEFVWKKIKTQNACVCVRIWYTTNVQKRIESFYESKDEKRSTLGGTCFTVYQKLTNQFEMWDLKKFVADFYIIISLWSYAKRISFTVTINHQTTWSNGHNDVSVCILVIYMN